MVGKGSSGRDHVGYASSSLLRFQRTQPLLDSHFSSNVVAKGEVVVVLELDQAQRNAKLRLLL